MDLATYETHVRSEAASRRYLVGLCWNNHQRFCPRCRSRKLYRLSDGRRRCSRCDFAFHDFTGRWLNDSGLTPGQWLRLIKLFELEVGPRQACEQLGVAYATAYKAMCLMRWAVLAHAHDADMYFGDGAALPRSFQCVDGNAGKPPAGELPVFGISGTNGSTRVSLLPGMWAETVYYLNLRTASLGQVVYTDPYREWDALVFCGRSYVCPGRAHAHSVGVDGSRGFWSFCKDRLRIMSGVSAVKFPLYIKELEFRYANRGKDLFSIVARYLCDFTPEIG